ncbi:MAG: hypothetical protein ABIF87_00180 [Pseudomonadota bacterium]
MKIQDSNILMASTRTFAERDEEKEMMRAWVDPQHHEIADDRVTISREAKCCMAAMDITTDEVEIDACTKHQLTLDMLLVEVLSGRKCKILDASMLEGKSACKDEEQHRVQTEDQAQEEKVGWGIEYHSESSHYESEDVAFVAAGIIRTTDGQEIDFALRLDMSREFVSYHSLNLRAGDAALIDPLVVNFNGSAAELSNMKFTFDLDSDGVSENLPSIGPGSGFLALDKNNDGIINNGTELFGPRTGDGFAELSEFDEDGNSWIDENDPVYDQISVWTMAEQGTSSLSSLRDRNIGAIYLGNLASEFDLSGSNNELMGKVRTTGIFLSQNGSPGTIQQLDLVV